MTPFAPLTSGNIQYVLAFIIIVQAGVIATLFKMYTQSKNDRINDLKGINSKIADPLSSLSQTINLIYDKLRDGRK